MRSSGGRMPLRSTPERALRWGLLALSRRRLLGRLATATPITRPLVHRFVAGQSWDEALPRLSRLTQAGLHSTVDVLGEAVASREAAAAAADRYLETLDALAAAGLDRNVSLKLSQMGMAVDPALAAANVRRIVEHAGSRDAFVRIDMEGSATTAATLGLHRELWDAHRNVGVVIQAALRRSAADVHELIAAGVPVRLCKGAYQEPASVAFQSRAEVDRSYADLMELLLRHGAHPAIATHDERLVGRAIALARREEIDPGRWEFQMLYGVRRDLQDRLVAAGYTVRVYVPFGREWYPYFMRRLAERPANVAFVLRSLIREGRSDRS
jgi:proline dehydrogenase